MASKQFEAGIKWGEDELAAKGYANASTNAVLFTGFGWLDERARSRDNATVKLRFEGKWWATAWSALGLLLGGIIAQVFGG